MQTALNNQVLSSPKFPVRTPRETDSKEQEKGSLTRTGGSLGTALSSSPLLSSSSPQELQLLARNWVTLGSFLAAPQVWRDAVLETTLCQDINNPQKQSIKHIAQGNSLNRTIQNSFWKCLSGSVPRVQEVWQGGM